MKVIQFRRARGLCFASILAVSASLVAVGGSASAAAVKVQLVKTGGGWQLLRGGKPYFIKGAGGSYSLGALKAAGGNSGRTWGADGFVVPGKVGCEARIAFGFTGAHKNGVFQMSMRELMRHGCRQAL